MAGTTADELTAQQEAFCLAYLETGNAAESYRRAYNTEPNARDNWIYVEASQLLDKPKVALRLKTLQDEAAKLSLYSVKAAYDELEEARKLAHAEKNPSAAVSAVAGKMKLFGLEKAGALQVKHTGPDGGAMKLEIVKRIVDAPSRDT